MSGLRERLIALAASARINVFAGDAPIQTKESLALAAARLALDEAARELRGWKPGQMMERDMAADVCTALAATLTP